MNRDFVIEGLGLFLSILTTFLSKIRALKKISKKKK